MNDNITYIMIGSNKIGLVGLEQAFRYVQQMNLKKIDLIKAVLLEKIKEQNFIPPQQENEYGCAILREYQKMLGLKPEPEPPASDRLTIQVLGPGCASCEKMEQDIKTILAELNIAAEVQHIRDLNRIAYFGPVRTPTLVINNEIILNGRSLPHAQLRRLITEKLDIS